MKIRTFAFLSVVVGLVVPAFAQDVIHSVQGRTMIYRNEDVATLPLADVQKALKLTDTQVAAVKALLNLRTESLKTAAQNLEEKQKALHTVLGQQNPAAIDIGNAYLALQTAQNVFQGVEDKFRTDFQALLTADQRATVESLKNASSQIGALRRLGVIGAEEAHFEFGLPVPGPLGWSKHIGGEIHIEHLK